ncbi:hypothetical protein ACTFIT_006362 [Dictyostelium discoideum]
MNRELKAVDVLECIPNNKLFAITIDDVFTEEECKEWIDLTEKTGYEPALVNIGYGQQQLMTDIRNNDRCIIDSVEMADKIYQRVKKFIPHTFNQKWEVVSLNERLRFLRYYVGQEFKKHQDGNYKRNNGETSFITLQLYLNNVEEGGSTKFFLKSGQNEIEIIPKPGKVLLFQHNIWHQGSPVTKGVKYVIRTDVMYD